MNKPTEASLSQSIDKLAQRKAEEYLRKVYESVQKALKDSYRPAGDTYFAKKDVIAVLELYVSNLKANSDCSSQKPSPELINAFRVSILDKLLSELPTVTQLAKLHEEGTTE
jgi:hypothetical protein